MDRLSLTPRFALALLLLGLFAGAGIWFFSAPTPAPTPRTNAADDVDRVAIARAAKEAKLRAITAQQGLQYPPEQLLLAAYKEEGELEVWAGARDAELRRLSTYPLTARSGHPGPKRREGDRQIPEGFYLVDRFNPKSAYHLSLGLNYPNEADRHFADKEHPGGDIFIHGKAASVGCLAIGDEAIEELFVLAVDVRSNGEKEIPVYIFPARMDSGDWQTRAQPLRAETPAIGAFWDELLPLYGEFVAKRRRLPVQVDKAGRYQLLPR